MEIFHLPLIAVATPVGFLILVGGLFCSVDTGLLFRKSGLKLLNWFFACLVNLSWVVALQAGSQNPHNEGSIIFGLFAMVTGPFGIGWLLGLFVATAPTCFGTSWPRLCAPGAAGSFASG